MCLSIFKATFILQIPFYPLMKHYTLSIFWLKMLILSYDATAMRANIPDFGSNKHCAFVHCADPLTFLDAANSITVMNMDRPKRT